MAVIFIFGKAAASTRDGKPAPQPMSPRSQDQERISGMAETTDSESAMCFVQNCSGGIAVRLVVSLTV